LKKPTEKGWWSGSRCRPSVQTPVLPKKIKNLLEKKEKKTKKD
jgi:hypothetical protein